MMRGKNIAVGCALAYVLIGLFTFGHAAANATGTTGTFNPRPIDAFDRTFIGAFWAIGWPLYWSWELQE